MNITLKKAYDYFQTSPMFKFSLSSKELFHSNFLEWLSNIEPDAFINLINKMAGSDNYQWPKNWRVKREYNNFDICIVGYGDNEDNIDDYNDDDKDFRILFVIENKVKSIPYKEQLKKYSNEADSINKRFWKKIGEAAFSEVLEFDWIGVESGKWTFKKGKNGRGKKAKWADVKQLNEISVDKEVDGKKSKKLFLDCYARTMMSKNPIHYTLLSLAKNFPGKESDKEWQVDDNHKWKVCNYGNYKKWINKYFIKHLDGLNKDIVKDYCLFIEYLTKLSSQWEMDYKDNQKFLYYDNENFKMAKKSRIHDLYQKLKFSHLCMILFNKIKDLYGEFSIFPSNQGGLFKENKNLEGWGSDNKYICISYTYLHGEPLLEINVHPGLNNDPEIYYGIQVQGKSYEHGIQVKGKKAEKVWEMLKKGELVIIDNWMNIPDNNKNGWKDCNQTDYNKYDTQDNTFIYQKIEIEENALISAVTTKMLEDLEQVINALKKT